MVAIWGMIPSGVWLVVGAILVYGGADWLVTGAQRIGEYTRLSPVVIGVVLVGFGTSLPEILISVFAVLQGSSDIAIANAYGSNIANIGLIIGVSLVIGTGLRLEKGILRRDLALMAVMLLAGAFPLSDGLLTRWESLFLLGMLGVYLGLSLRWGQDQPPSDSEAPQSLFWVWVRALLGLGVLLLGADIFTSSAITVARELNVSEAVIGLTMVALGTSIPELAAVITASLRKETELIFGNIIGSCVFNVLCVVGIAGVLRGLAFSQDLVMRDIPLSLLFALGLGLVTFAATRNGTRRWQGGIMLSGYGAYVALLWFVSLSP